MQISQFSVYPSYPKQTLTNRNHTMLRQQAEQPMRAAVSQKFQGVKFAGGSGSDPFSYAYNMGKVIQEISKGSSALNPLQIIVDSAGGAFNLYHLHKIDSMLHDIKSRVVLLQDANLGHGVEMLDSSVVAASQGKKKVAFRDLGLAKNAFALAVQTSSTASKRALALEYLAQCYELDGMKEKATESRKKSFDLLKNDFEKKARHYGCMLNTQPRLGAYLAGFGKGFGYFFSQITVDALNTSAFVNRHDYDTVIAEELLLDYAKTQGFTYSRPSDIKLNYSYNPYSTKQLPLEKTRAQWLREAEKARNFAGLEH